MGWEEVADRVYRRRYEPFDVSVSVVRGDDGLLLVDSRSSHREAREVLRDLAPFGAPVRWVVNTHAHFDHVFGNHVFGSGAAAPAAIYGHRRVPAHLAEHEVPMLATWLRDGSGPVTGLDEVLVTPPDHLVDHRLTVDLGDRHVDLLHLGRGHTDNDLVLRVAGCQAWVVGDLVEESGPPSYGPDSFPLEWPATVAALLTALPADAVVVPGHGAAVDRLFVARQQADLDAVADLVVRLHTGGTPEQEALEAGSSQWPFPPEQLAAAVRRGYQQLQGTEARVHG